MVRGINFGQCDLELWRSSASTWSTWIPCVEPRGPPGAGGADSRRGPGGRCVSLDHLEVVQDGHDVLRHEDVAGVDGHAGHGDEQRVWRRGVKEGNLEAEGFVDQCTA